MSKVIVYGRDDDSCVQCNATVRLLTDWEIPFDKKDVGDPAVLAEALSHGIRSLPIVVAGDQKWGGHLPSMISKLRA